MKVLNSSEYINEKLNIQPISKEKLKNIGDCDKPKSYYDSYIGYVFAFKNIAKPDRDAVKYVRIENGRCDTNREGEIKIEGANFLMSLDDDDEDAKYSDYETVLSEEQFNAFKGKVSDEMNYSIVKTLLSRRNEKLIEKVKRDEIKIIARECGVSEKTAKDIVDDYPSNNEYFDHGICHSYDNVDVFVQDLIMNFGAQSWLVNFLKDNYDGEDDEITEYLEVAEDCGDLSYDTLVSLGYDFSKIDPKDVNDDYHLMDNGVVIEYYK